MKPLAVLAVLLLFPFIVRSQTNDALKELEQLVLQPVPKQEKIVTSSPELKALRDEYIKSTREYQESLRKLLPFYEQDVTRTEEKLEQSKRLLAEGVIPESQVDENVRALASAKQKVAETNRAILDADDQIIGVANEPVLLQEYKQAVQQRRKARKPRCSNWTMTASRRTTHKSVSFSYRFICQD